MLGPVEFALGGAAVRLGGPRQVTVLARLLVSAGRVVSMDQLAASVWDGDAPAHPDVAIRSYVSNLRRTIEPARDRGDRRSCIESQLPGYRLTVAPDSIDANEYERLVLGARRSLTVGRDADALAALDRADRLWRGVPCQGVIATDAFTGFAARYTELHLSMREMVFEARLGLGDHEAVVADIETVIADNPLRERLTELGMLALYRAGRQSEALGLCHVLRRRLLEDLGIDPGPAVQALEHRILVHDASLAPEAGLRVPGTPDRLSLVGPTGAVGLEADRDGPEVVGFGPVGSVDPPVPGPPLVPFVGRGEELSSLGAVAAALGAGAGATAVITGEDGIGKSAVAARLADRLRGDSALVIEAWATERTAATPLWPWSQVLGALRRQGVATGPATGKELGSDEASSSFSSLVDLLRHAAGDRPVVVVLEDLHWADATTVELLQFAATALRRAPVAFVATWRDTAAIDGSPVRALRHLGRLPALVRVELGPLDELSVRQLVTATVGLDHPALERLADRVVEASAGHPLTVLELARAGFDDRGRLRVSTTLRDAVLDRVERCGADAAIVLAATSLHGRTVVPALVAEALEQEPDRIEAIMEGASRRRILVDNGDGTFGFAAPVMAWVVADELTGPRRARLHAALGRALWRIGAPPALLVRHFSRAASPGTAVLAARFAVESVSGNSTFAELDRATEAVAGGLDAIAALDSPHALEIGFLTLLVHGSWLCGDGDTARRAGDRLVALAERSGGPATWAQAVAAVTGPPLGRDRPDPLGLLIDGPAGDDNRGELLERFLPRSDRDDDLGAAIAVRARRLAPSPFPSPGWWRRQLAAAAGDDGTAVSRLVELARFLLERGSGPDRDLVARLLAGRSADDDGHLLLAARRLELFAAVESAQPAPAPAGTGAGPFDASSSTPVELDSALLAVTVDLLEGRLEAAAAAIAAMTAFIASGSRPVGPVLAAQRLVVAWDQGLPPDEPRSAVEAAFVAAEADDRQRAGRLLDELAVRPELGPDDRSLAPAALVAMAAHRCGHVAAARAAWAVLHRERSTAPVILGPGAAILGSAGYFAGLAAATTGRSTPARELLVGAERWARLVGARPALVRALVASAELDAVDHDRHAVERRLTEAASVAAEIGLGWFESRRSP
ncbi:MAG: BTAD domain-containing putative transcriptional regulator [Acidimicrobiales bacterium]